jgi:uncharacterized membrane protein
VSAGTATRPPLRRRVRLARLGLRLVLVAFFGVAGVQHLTDPGFFHPQYPDFLPMADAAIRSFGLLVLAGSVGLLGSPAVRRRAAPGLVVLLLLVWPGNWWGALQPGSYVRPGAPNLLDWVRVAFQLVLIAAVVWANLDALRRPVIRRAP